MRKLVWSLTSLIGVRIQHCRELWCRWPAWLRYLVAVAAVYVGSCSSDLTPSLGTSIYHGVALKKAKKQTNKQTKLNSCLLNSYLKILPENHTSIHTIAEDALITSHASKNGFSLRSNVCFSTLIVHIFIMFFCACVKSHWCVISISRRMWQKIKWFQEFPSWHSG